MLSIHLHDPLRQKTRTSSSIIWFPFLVFIYGIKILIFFVFFCFLQVVEILFFGCGRLTNKVTKQLHLADVAEVIANQDASIFFQMHLNFPRLHGYLFLVAINVTHVIVDEHAYIQAKIDINACWSSVTLVYCFRKRFIIFFRLL